MTKSHIWFDQGKTADVILDDFSGAFDILS